MPLLLLPLAACGGGGSDAPALTFVVTQSVNNLVFEGTATGDVSVEVASNGNMSFSRGDVPATQDAVNVDDVNAAPEAVLLSNNITGMALADAAKLVSITNFSANGKTIAISDSISNAASSLLAVDAAFSAVDASTLTTLSGTAADVNAAYASVRISGLGNEAVTLGDTTLAAATLNTVNGNTTGVVNAASVTTLTGTAADVNAAYTANTAGEISGLGNEAVTLGDTTLAAAMLNTVNGNTTGVVNAASVTTLTGTAADVNAAYTANTASEISGLGNEAVTLTDGTFSADTISSVAAKTTGALNVAGADTVTGSAASISTLIAGGRVQFAADVDFTISAGAVDAADLISMNAATTGVVDARDVTTIEGTAADVLQILGDAGITNPVTFTVKLVAGSNDAADVTGLFAFDAVALVNAASATNLTGSIAEINAVLVHANITKPITMTATVDAGSEAAADLTTLLAQANVTSVSAAAVTTLTGTATEVLAVLNEANITDPTAATVTIEAGTEAAADLSTILADAGITSVDASAVTTLTGSASAVLSVLNEANITDPTAATVTISAGTHDAADLTTILADGGITSVEASAATTLTGSVTEINAVLTEVNITNPTTMTATVDAGTEAAAGMTALLAEANVTSVSAAAVTTLTGTATEVLAVLNEANITDPTAATVTVDAGTEAAADLSTILADAGITSVDASAVTTLTGSASAVLSVLNEVNITDPTAATVTISAGTHDAADLTMILADGGITSVDASAATTLTGSVTEISAVLAEGGITNPTTMTATVDAGTEAASDLTALLAEANVTSVSAAAVTTLTGSVTEINAVLTEVNIMDPTTMTATVDAGTEAASDLTALLAEANVTSVSAAAVTTLTGTATEVLAVLNEANITDPTAATVAISAGAEGAADLTTILADSGITSVNATAVTTLTGTAGEIKALYDAGVTFAGNVNFVVDVAATAAELEAIDGLTTGTLTATLAAGETALDLSGATTSTNTIVLNDDGVTVTGSSQIDVITVGAGADTLNLGDGADIVNIDGVGYADGDVINTEGGNDQINVSGDNTVIATDVISINGGDGTTDTLIVSDTNDFTASTISNVEIEVRSDVTFTIDQIAAADGSIKVAADVAGDTSLSHAITIKAAPGGATSVSITKLEGITSLTVVAGVSVTLSDAAATELAAAVAAADPGVATGITLDPTSTFELSAAAKNTLSGGVDPLIAPADLKYAINDVTASILAEEIAGAGYINGAVGITVQDAIGLADFATISAARGAGINIVLDGGISDTAANLAPAGAVDARLTNAVTQDPDVAITVTGVAPIVAEVNSIAGATTGAVTATLSVGDMATLGGLSTGSGDAISVVVTDASVDAGAVVALAGKTSLNVDATAVDEITGTVVDIVAAATTTPNLLLAADYTVVASNAGSVANVNTIAAATTGIVTVTVSEGDMTTLASLATEATDAITVVVTDARVVASELIALDAKTSVTVNAGQVETLTGTVEELSAYRDAFNAKTISGKLAYAVVASDTTDDVADLINLADPDVTNFDPDVYLPALTSMTGSASDVIDLYNLTNVLQNEAGDALGDEAVTLTDTTLAASVLNSVDTKTTGLIDASTVTTLTGAAADMNTAYASAGLTGLGDEASTLSDVALDAAILETLVGNTSGAIDATSIVTLTGAASEIIAAINAGVSFKADVVINVDEPASAADISIIAAITTGAVTATSSTTAVADLLADLTTNGTTDDISITVSDTSADAADLSAINALTAAVAADVDLTAVTEITGSADAIKTAMAANGVSLTLNGTYDIVASGDTSVSDINLIVGLTGGAGATTGTITASAASTDATVLAGLTTTDARGDVIAITVTGSATGAELNTISGATTSEVAATGVTEVTGTAGAIALAVADADIAMSGSYSVTVDGPGASVSELNTIFLNTTGLVTSTVTTQAFVGAGNLTTLAINADGAVPALTVTVADVTANAADLTALQAKTSVNVDAILTVNGIAGSVSEIDALIESVVDLNGNYDLSISDGTLDILDAIRLNGENGTGSVAIAAATTITGTASELAAAITSGTISVPAGANFVVEAEAEGAVTSVGDLDIIAVFATAANAVDTSAISIVEGPAATLDNLQGYASIASGSTYAVTVNNGADSNASVSAILDMRAETSGVITATVTDVVPATLATLKDDVAPDTDSADQLTISVDAAALPAADLLKIVGATGLTVDATAATSVTGSASDVLAALQAGANFGDPVSVPVTITGATAASSDVNAIDALTAGVIDATAVGTLSGSAADVVSAWAAATFGAGVTVTTTEGAMTVAEFNVINAATSGVITATIDVSTSLEGVDALDDLMSNAPGLENVLTIAVSGADLDAQKLADLVTVTSLGVDASGVTSVVGNLVALGNLSDVIVDADGEFAEVPGAGEIAISTTAVGAFNDEVIDLENMAAAVVDFPGVLDFTQASLVQGGKAIFTQIETELTADPTSIIFDAATNAELKVETDIDAALLLYIDGTLGTVDATAVSEVTGSASALTSLVSAVDAGTISLNANVDFAADDSIDVSLANALTGLSGTGNVLATIAETDIATLKTLTASLDNELTITVADTQLAAADLLAVNAATTLEVDATAVNRVNGALADALLLKADVEGNEIEGLTDARFYLSDTGSNLVGDVISLANFTTGRVYSVSETYVGLAADLGSTDNPASFLGAINAGTLITNSAFSLQLASDDIGTLDPILINADVLANLVPTMPNFEVDVDASIVSQITGSAQAIAAIVANSAFTLDGNYDVVLNTATADPADILTILADTSGTVDAGNSGVGVTQLVGTAQDAADVLAARDSGAVVDFANVNVEATDESIAASLVTSLSASNGGGNVDITDATLVTGTDAQAASVAGEVDAGTVVWNNPAVTISENAAVAHLNTINAETSGVITATVTETDVVTLKTLTAGDNALTVTIDAGPYLASEVVTISAATTLAVNASAVSGISGSAAEIDAVIAQKGTASGLSLSDTFTVSVGAPGATVDQLNSYVSAGVGKITSAVTNTSIADLVGLTTAATDDITTTVATTSVTAADLVTIDGHTAVAVDATAVTAISGDAAGFDALETAALGGSVLLNNFAATVSGTYGVAGINALAARATGVVTATVTEDAIADLIGVGGLTTAGTDAISVTLAAADTIAVADLLTLNGLTSVEVNAEAIATITGSMTDLLSLRTAVLADQISIATGTVNLTVTSGTLDAAPLAIETALNVLTLADFVGGLVDVTAIDQINGTAEDLATLEARNDVEIALEVATEVYAAQPSDATMKATDILALGTANATGTVDLALVSTIRGEIDDINSVIAGGADNNIQLAIKAYNFTVITDEDGAATATVTQANALTASAGGGIVTATISNTDIVDLDDLAASAVNALTITVAGASLDAAQLNTVDAATTVQVTTSEITELTGTAAAAETAMASAGLDLNGQNINVIIDDGSASISQLNNINGDNGTGTITATLSASDLADMVDGVNGLTTGDGDSITITLKVESVSATDLVTLEGKTGLQIDAKAATEITGLYADVKAVLDDTTNFDFTDADYNVTLADNAAFTADDLITITGMTDGLVTATSIATVTGNVADLVTVATRNDGADLALKVNYDASIVLAGGDPSAVSSGDLKTILSDTTGSLTASALTDISGAAADIKDVQAGNFIHAGGDYTVSVSGTNSVADINSIAGNTAGVVTATASVGFLAGAGGLLQLTTLATDAISVAVTDASATADNLLALDGVTSVAVNATGVGTITGTAAKIAEVVAAETAGTITLADDFAATLSAGSVDAADVLAIDSATTGTVDATAVTGFTGTGTEIAGVVSAGAANINIDGDFIATVDGGSTATVAELNTIDAATSGIITATISEGDLITLTTLTNGSGNNALTITVTDTSAAATDLAIVNGVTNVDVVATAVQTITGAIANVKSVFTSAGFTLATDVKSTISNVTLDAADVAAIDALTSGLITITNATEITGTAAEIAAVAGSAGVNDNGSFLATVEAGSVAAADVKTIDGETTTAIAAEAVTEFTGTAADIADVIGSAGVLKSTTSALTVNSGTASVAQIQALDAGRTGVITATVTETDAATLKTLTNNGNNNVLTITVNTATVNPADLTTIASMTTLAVTASSVTTLSGAAADANAVYASGDFVGLGDEAVTLNDTTLAASVLNTLNGNTTGVVDADTVGTLTGAASDVSTALSAGALQISGLGDQNVTLSDTSIAATAMATLSGQTTGTINADTVATVTGLAADVATALGNQTGLGGNVSNFTDQNVTLSDVVVDAADLVTVNARTTGTVDATLRRDHYRPCK